MAGGRTDVLMAREKEGTPSFIFYVYGSVRLWQRMTMLLLLPRH